MLTEKQKRFCDEYLVDLNGTQAAIRAGYSKKSARFIGSDHLTKPNIRAYIDKRLEDAAMSKTEALKLVSDIAKGNLGDYFVSKKVRRSTLIEKPLKQVIAEEEMQIDFENEYAEVVGLKDDELKFHQQRIEARKREIIRLKLELKRNPKAKRIVQGPDEIVEEVQLDISQLVADKERGRIKSITPSEHGLKVELYSADAALNTMLKIHGAFEKDNDQKKPEVVTPFTDEQRDKLLAELNK